LPARLYVSCSFLRRNVYKAFFYKGRIVFSDFGVA